MTTNQKETIKPLLVEHGEAWATIARVLNNAGIKTSRGKEWTDDNVRAYVNRNLPDWKPQGEGARVDNSQEKENRPPMVNVSPKVTQQTPENRQLPKVLAGAHKDGSLEGVLALYRSGSLDSLLKWWEDNQGISATAPERRPLFKGKRKNTGIHLSADILNRAQAKSREDRLRTGGSLSQLVEWLLWRYLGSPPDLVEGIAPDDPPAAEPGS